MIESADQGLTGAGSAPMPAIGQDAAGLRAHLTLGNVTIARHQLGIMLALGVERVICIAQKLDVDTLRLQHFAEAAGVKFHVVTGPRGLLGLITATDELLALADRVLAWPKIAADILDRAGVVVQGVDEGIAAGFERLDAQYAAGGALRIPGRLVERLAELPHDSDTFSALQRIALQAGINIRELPAQTSNKGCWNLVRHDDDAHAIETHWIRLHSEVRGARNLATRIAQWAVRRIGPALLHAGSGNLIVANAGVVLALLALISGWFGWVSLGLILTAIAAILFISAHFLGQVESEMQQLPPQRAWRASLYGWLVDLVFFALLLWNGTKISGENLGTETLLNQMFAPLVLLGLLRILPRLQPRSQDASDTTNHLNWRIWLQDRSILAAVLLGASLSGILTPMVLIFALVLIALGAFGGTLGSDNHGVIQIKP